MNTTKQKEGNRTRKDWRDRNKMRQQNIAQTKKFANRKVRRTEDVVDGTFYKKVFDSYDIRD